MTAKKLKPMLPGVNAELKKAKTSEETKKILGRAFVAAGLAPGALSETNEAFQAFLLIDSMDKQNDWMAEYLPREMYQDYADTHNEIVELLQAEASPGQKLKIQSVSGIADFYSDVEGEPMISGQYVGFMLTMQPGESQMFKICLVFNDDGVLFRQFLIGDATVERNLKTN